MSVKRLFVQKKENFCFESKRLYKEIVRNIDVPNLKYLKIINIYDVENIHKDILEEAKRTVFSDPMVDILSEDLNITEKFFVISLNPGQYDQRAQSAKQCLEILQFGKSLKLGIDCLVKTSKAFALGGQITTEEIEAIQKYIINPVETCIINIKKPFITTKEFYENCKTTSLNTFIFLSESELKQFLKEQDLAMDLEDLKFCQNYFKNEKRYPTITELKLIDTYWSDHCRHATFNTILDSVKIENKFIISIYEDYLNMKKEMPGEENSAVTFMDLATIYARYIKKKGKLEKLDESDEINAASFEADVLMQSGEIQKWLIMFKNETHNHPTEIEPFGGAATCLGGAIRDPLSGRSYVYQSLRVSGAANPLVPNVIPAKLSQHKITVCAAKGFSSYGNQIGVSTGHVCEVYNDGYRAKRLECGFVIGAVPKENVYRSEPLNGDVIILIGGKTGIDGIGGATGSSKSHDDKTSEKCRAQVQKGNPLEERKIQRLFRKKEVTKLMKRCNDFGAGGVSVAIGEIAKSVLINLDKIPKKYGGISATEIALSESQERMAVVVSRFDSQRFIEECEKENLEATIVGQVTNDNRIRMIFEKNEVIADIKREFLDSSGSKKYASVEILDYDFSNEILKNEVLGKDLKEKILKHMGSINASSRIPISSMFDSTVGANNVLMPYGGKYQTTAEQTMVSKLPIYSNTSDFATCVSFGLNPEVALKNPFLSAVYSIVGSVTKLVATGCDFSDIYLSFQEYFEKLQNNPKKWGKVFATLLGAFYAQKNLSIASICGKDSMSGSYENLHVPPTFISFAVGTMSASQAVSSDFKESGSLVFLIKAKYEKNGMLDFEILKKNYTFFKRIINEKKIKSSYALENNGIIYAICNMCFGNKLGFEFSKSLDCLDVFLFKSLHGGIIFETDSDEFLDNENCIYLGKILKRPVICFYEKRESKEHLELDLIFKTCQSSLKEVFEPNCYEFFNDNNSINVSDVLSRNKCLRKHSFVNFSKPRVFVPIFPGTNCEYETIKAFEKAGAKCEDFVFKNLKKEDIMESIEKFVLRIKKSQIIVIPGGFSGGDEPDGSGKFIATVFRNYRIQEAIENFLALQDGLILGICNGFQALVKIGLLPYGKIRNLGEDSIALTYNKIGHYMSRMVNVKITSKISPWFSQVNLGEIYTIPISHGEGRFVANEKVIKTLEKNSQIASQYVDLTGAPTLEFPFNPNGSMNAIESISSIDGKILGKMGHSERVGENICKNVPGKKYQKIFESGVSYFS